MYLLLELVLEYLEDLLLYVIKLLYRIAEVEVY
jgi:hypothetical protein